MMEFKNDFGTEFVENYGPTEPVNASEAGFGETLPPNASGGSFGATEPADSSGLDWGDSLGYTSGGGGFSQTIPWMQHCRRRTGMVLKQAILNRISFRKIMKRQQCL